MLDLNHLFLTIVISFLSFRVFLFLGLVGMSYSLWMWIRNGVIFIMILYAPVTFDPFSVLQFCFSLWLLKVNSASILISFSFSCFSFSEPLSLSGLIPWVSSEQPWHFHICREPDAPTRWKLCRKQSLGFWKVLTWIGSELNANSMQPWIDLKEKLLFSSDCEQCLCPKATPKGRNILSAHEAHQPLWRHRRCCLWQGEDFDGGDSEGLVMMILATHWSNWGWFWLHAVLDD